MTDIANWPELIHKQTLHPKTHEVVVEGIKVYLPIGGRREYVMVPLEQYQMGNLLGLLKRSQEHNNGDWFHELIHIISEAMRKLHIEELQSNWGDVFGPHDKLLEQVFE